MHDIVDEVERHRSQAEESGCTVLYLDRIPDYLFIISDPDTLDGWIRIEEFDLKKHHNQRQSYIIYRREQEHLFNTLLSYYEHLWTISLAIKNKYQ